VPAWGVVLQRMPLQVLERTHVSRP
jgi:hypothetical protein